MSATDRQRIDIDLRSDLGADVPLEAPRTATLELTHVEGGDRTVTIDHGQDEWVLEFDSAGKCVDRDPPTRPLPQWISDAIELVRGELR